MKKVLTKKKAQEPANVPLSIMEEAQKIIYGDREKTYGRPEVNLETIANFWGVYLKRRKTVKGSSTALTAIDVCQMMILLKQARLLNDPTHRDSQIDMVGYAGLMERCQEG